MSLLPAMSSPSSTPSLFKKLSARPPTPPRDVSKDIDHALRFLQHGHEEPAQHSEGNNLEKVQSGLRPHTSTDTPPSKAASVSPQARGSHGKRVDFSPWPTYHDVPRLGVSSSPDNRARRQTPVSRETKPLKSILKAHEPVPLTPEDLENKLSYFSPQDPGSFRKMLQGIIVQLSSPSRDTRRDAYMAVNGVIKKYQGLPEVQAIVDKIDLLRQFLARDLAWKDPTGALDTQIVTQAVQLTCSILTAKDAASALDDDFRAFVVDRCITCLEQPDMPRAILKSHLHILAVQRFKANIITVSRVERLVTALQTMEDRNSTVVVRLIIYQRLVEQASAAMLSRMPEWIENVFHALLSSVSEVQSRAINTCATAGLLLGHQQAAAKVIYDMCERETDDGKSYGDFLNFQLIQLSADPSKAAIVPQIWAAVILFFRNKRRSVDKWPKFRAWLLTMQKCLNSSDLEVKQHAHMAWNKLIFTIMPDATTAETVYSMLKVPIVASLEKKGGYRSSQEMRQIAMDSYCNLLHYALRPALSHEELDRAWGAFVHPVLTAMSKNGGRGQYSACRILHGFLKKTSGAWNENAANEKDAIKADDLPRLDVRWVRSRLDKFIHLLEPMLLAGMWQSPESNKPLTNIWRSLMRAVAEAGSQEVRTSSELKVAIAQLTNLFRRIWFAPSKTPSHPEDSAWIDRYQAVVGDTVELIGPAHFVEDILTKISADDIEVAPTPSHRPSKHHQSTCSAFTILFSLYYQTSPSLRLDVVYRDSAVWFLGKLGNVKGSASGNLSLLHNTLQACAQVQTDRSEEVRGQLWSAVAAAAGTSLRIQASVSPQWDAAIAGVSLKHALSILLNGLCFAESCSECIQELAQLVEISCTSAKHIAGNGGIVLAVVEPLSKLILEKMNSLPLETTLRLYRMVVKQGVWPKNKAELDASRKALWTISLEPCKTQVFDSFCHLYEFFNSSLQRAYSQMQSRDDDVVDFAVMALSSTVDFLRKCPHPILPVAMRKFQAGFVPWIEDPRRMMFPADRAETEELSALPSRIQEMWGALLRVVSDGYVQKDSTLLGALEPILIAGFSSPSKDVINSSIVFWNANFADQASLEYPMRLLPVLRACQAQADFTLPGYPRAVKKSEVAPLPSFAETQLEFSSRRRSFSIKKGPSPAWKPPAAENIFIKQHLAAQGLPFDAAAVALATASCSSPMPKVRLRHNNSQVDFAPIVAQPPVVESQLLTEHQKEVRARQHDDAQVFPELSSSPVARSISTKNIFKKLDFSSDSPQVAHGEMHLTPAGPPEGQLMSDDLPSSPTPRGGAHRTYDAAEPESEREETDVDPPSSPPRKEDMHNSRGGREEVQSESTTEACATAHDIAAGLQDLVNERELASAPDLLSETLLPNAQLHREEAEANETTVDILSGEERAEEKQCDNAPETASRIENSIVEPNAPPVATPSEADTDESKSMRLTRKRKRTSETTFTSRKKNPQSPFQRLMSRVLRTSQDEDDDIEEEIVVAPRTVSSPPNSVGRREPSPSAQLEEPATREDQSSEQNAPAKRGRGRPRKSQSQESRTVASAAVAGMKRSASAMSTRISGDEASTSVVEDTPVPRKARKQREVQLSQDALVSRESVRAARSTLRSESAMVEQDDNQASQAAAAKANEHQGATRGRRIAQPASILERLRGILSDCKGMILGSQEEERKFDDVLFQIRREVHEAGR